MNKKIVIAISFLVVLAVVVSLVLFFWVLRPSLDLPTSGRGNTIGNSVNFGIVTADDDWVFYIDTQNVTISSVEVPESQIIRMRDDGSEREVIYTNIALIEA